MLKKMKDAALSKGAKIAGSIAGIGDNDNSSLAPSDSGYCLLLEVP